ncbi:MAG: FecR family protein [Fischerella sp.]|nr:FecR family protein [Fischerella sp.]
MFRKLFPLVTIGFWGIMALPLLEQANAATPLTRAVIRNLRNWVQLMPQNKPKRPARKSDAIVPGDGLSTGRASLAELRFNDGSLARVGEQAVFRFLPKSRNLRLSNGTVLLLIPPGQGRTRINTPNAAAAIRGSALFVRYDEKKDTTIVAALTNSGIEVSNQNASQNQELKAGQLLVIVKDKIQGLYEFDLRTFYETSNLVQDLDLAGRSAPSSDPAIAKVQAETAAAVASQSPLTGKEVVENPPFTQLSTDPSPNNNPSPNTNPSDSPLNSRVNNDPPVNSLQETGQVLSDTEQQKNNSNNQETSTGSNPANQPPQPETPPTNDSTAKPNPANQPPQPETPPINDSTGGQNPANQPPQPETPPINDSTAKPNPANLIPTRENPGSNE